MNGSGIMALEIRPQMASGFFAEIYGADLSACDDATFQTIHEAHLRHGVIAICDQNLTPEQQMPSRAVSARCRYMSWKTSCSPDTRKSCW